MSTARRAKTISPPERILGGLWGAVVGDALGVPVEFESREEVRSHPVTGPRGQGTHGQPPGTWSDDSLLLLCTVDSRLLTTASYRDCVLKAVNLGDDTDTTGCVAGGLAGVAYGLRCIPAEWIAQLARKPELDQLVKEFAKRCAGRA